MSNDFPDLTIKQLLANNRYSVPRYQRNYAWTEEHIKQLIDDILDNAHKKEDVKHSYYLGTLVVFPRKEGDRKIYEVIDGQQRLTTLTLMASYLSFKDRLNYNGKEHWYSNINLDFESRKRSSETLIAAHNGIFHDSEVKKSWSNDFTEEIVDAYEIIKRLIPERCREIGLSEDQFRNYFLDQVRICRVDVPEDTDLNHYFEIMNNRGEQLEKHEVLKARLMNKLPPGSDQIVFNKIWEACSDMDKYIQYCFNKTTRESLFSKTWDRFEPRNTEKIYQQIAKNESSSNSSENEFSNGLSLEKLIYRLKGEYLQKNKVNKEDEEPERFSSIINFQNFLPHVLSVFFDDGEVLLDDKQLLDSFRLLEKSSPEKIKKFSWALLKMRFLFDQYIIKRDATEDEREWSLKKLHQTEQGNPSYRNAFSDQDNHGSIQRHITILQSMFHVSVPSRPYKYWLQGVLRYLFNQSEINGTHFKDYMEGQAKAFVYNRFLATRPLGYDELIFMNSGIPVQSQLDFHKTRYGQIENILLFNFIDYLLWKKQLNRMHGTSKKVNEFVFTFRSSVEHYYPQNPIDGNTLDNSKILHSIGNLCLISHSKNSMLRHHLPKAKAEYYLKQKHIDSILQHNMLELAEEWSDNPEETIQEQESNLFDLLKENKP